VGGGTVWRFLVASVIGSLYDYWAKNINFYFGTNQYGNVPSGNLLLESDVAPELIHSPPKFDWLDSPDLCGGELR